MQEHVLPAIRSISQADTDLYNQHHTEIMLLLNDFLLKYLSSLYKEFNGDITLAIVLGEIAHHTIGQYIRQGRLKSGISSENARDNVNNKVNIQACNPFSISEATGIPRETVRRKFTELEQLGYVDKISSRSYIMNPQAVYRFIPDFNLRLFEGFRILCTQMNEVFTKETAAKVSK